MSSRSKLALGWRGSTPAISAPLFEIVRQSLPVEARLTRLPVDTGDRRLIDHHQGRGPGADRGGKVGRRELFEIKLDHHIFGDLSALGGPVLQTVPARLHFRDAALEPGGQGLIGEGGANDGREDFMQVGEPLNGIGEGLLVDLCASRPEAVADGTAGGWRQSRDSAAISDGQTINIFLMADRERGCQTENADHGSLPAQCRGARGLLGSDATGSTGVGSRSWDFQRSSILNGPEGRYRARRSKRSVAAPRVCRWRRIHRRNGGGPGVRFEASVKQDKSKRRI